MPLPLPLPTTRVLSLRSVSVERDGHLALRNADLEAHAGRLIAVVGPNGSGKSTLLDLAAGLLTPGSGTIDRRAGIRTALVAQSTPLPAHLPMTVSDIVAMGTWGRLRFWRPMRTADRAAVTDAISTVGLEALADRRIGTLSGGQRQRAFLAQALVQRADLVLLDEPMAGLDAASRIIIAEAIGQLTAAGAAVIAVTHDLDELPDADAVIELRDGEAVPAIPA